jgi:hypothetical protein
MKLKLPKDDLINFEPSKADVMWLKSAQIFRRLHTDASIYCTPDISVEDFKKGFARSLRISGLKVEDIDSNVLLVDGDLFIWITRKSMPEEKIALTTYMHTRKIARLGYIIKIDSPPLWGRIQISRKHFVDGGDSPHL